MKKTFTTLLALTLFSAMASNAAAITLLTEDWQDAGWSGTDINVAPNPPLHGFVGYGLNDNNPTTLLGAGAGGNVLRDQTGFGGTYGSATSAGNAVRVRSSNGAMLNRDALALSAFDSVSYSFDLRQGTANYVQVVEFSTTQAFSVGTVLLLDTINGNTDLGLWIPKSYTLVNGVDATFTDTSYFRIRKLRPSPAGTNGGANSTFHTYDNLLITADVSAVTVPEPATATLALLGLGGLMMRRRRDLKA